jgi:DNA modification methylase
MLATEADVLRTLRTGTYTLHELYDLCEQRTVTGRDGGHDPVPGHAGDHRWKHRVRGALASLRRTGQADRISRTTWAIQGTPHEPARLLLIIAGAEPREFELRLAAAADLLAQLDMPADLVLCDPPYGLGRGTGRHYSDGNGYRRDHTRIVSGYQDVAPGEYEEFTHGWTQAAAAALRPGGQLAVVTGPQRAGIVQYAAEKAGLTWVSTIAARREFPLATTRRPSSAHWSITVMCRGPLASARRVFHPPADLPAARTGHPYPLDWWPDNGRADRPGLLRYDNSLPLRLVQRTVSAFSDPGEHVVDPFLGAGTVAVACWRTGRSFTGGDVNINAIRFAAARLLAEHAWPEDQQPALFPAETLGCPDATAVAHAARDFLPLTSASLREAGQAAASACAASTGSAARPSQNRARR